MPNSDMNVTLHFNYEQDAASYSKVMSALDQMQKKGVETLKARNMSDAQINEYINGFTKMKNAIESSFSPDLSTFSVGYASQLKEFQEGYATVQKYTDGAKVSIDNMGESFDSGALKIDKYSDKLDHFKLTLANAFRYNIVNRAIDIITNSIRDVINYVIELDSALNSIRIITGKSSDEMLQFAAANQESAKELGRTATEYAQASLIFYQQGLNDSQVKERTDAALKLANVTGQSVQEIVNQMTAIWNNFDDGSHNLEYYEDVITALGATTASSSKEIAGGLEKFAAIGNTVGLSYEYAASALATVVATTRQSEDVVGTAFKTMFARLQSLKLGESLDDGTTLTKYSKALQDIGVNILDQNGNLKDMDIILDEIGAKWQTLDRNQQTALANTVGGVRQYAQFIALFDNFDFFKENVTTALESAGTVTQQNTIYMESYEAKIKQIKATLDSIKFDMFMDQDFGGLLDFADSFLVSLRTIIHDFGGFNQILIVSGALLAQMFLPQIIQRFSQEFMKLKTQMDSMSNMNFGEKLKEIFSPKAGFKDINSVFEGLSTNYDNLAQKNALVQRASHDLGEKASNDLSLIIDKVKETKEQYDILEKQVTQIDAEDFKSLLRNKITNSDLNDELKQQLSGSIDDLIIPENGFQNAEQYVAVIKALKEEYKEILANSNVKIDIFDGEKIVAEADRAKTALEQFKKQWESLSTMGQITKLASAGAVAFRGLASAFEKFQEGDLLGGVAGGLTSIGSALMMIPGAQLAGGILTAAGTVTSVIKSQIEKAEKEAKETLNNYVETKKKYEDTISSLEELSTKYNRLSSKSSLTVDEQNELNNALEEMQKIMSEDGTYNLIAYYDEYGNAVYKTIDVINEYVEALKEKQRAELEDKRQEAEEAKNKVLKKDSIIQKYENYRDMIKEYNDIVNTIKTNNWSFEDIEKNTNINWSQLGISDVSSVISWYEARVSNAETEIERISDEYSSKIKEHWKETFDTEIDIPLDEIKLNIDDKNGRLFVDQFKNKINDAIQNEEIDVDKINISLITDELSKIQDWDGFVKGEDLDKLDSLKETLGEESELWQIITELINENTEALIANSEAFTNISDLNDSLNEGQEIIESLNEAFNEFNDTGELSISTMNELNEQLSQVDGWQELMDSWNDGSLTLDEFKTKMQELFNVWIDNQPVMQNLTEATKNQAIAWLESLGVSNAVEVVESKLAAQFYNTAMAIGTEEQATINALNAIPGFVEWLNQQGISLNEVANDTDLTEQMLIQFKNTVASGAGNLDVSGITGNLDLVIWKAQVAINALNSVAQRRQQQYGSLPNPDEEAGNYAPPTITTPEFPYSPGGGSSSKGGGGGGGGGGSQPYEAQLTGYEKVEDELEIIENRLKRIRKEKKNTDDIEEKIKLRQQENELLKEQQEKLHEINDLQRKDIADNIQKLRDNGFIIDYDPDAQEWIVHNREHLHDLNDELEKDMEQMIKDTDSLIDSTRKYSEEWREANKIIKDTEEDIQKLRDQQLKEEMNAFNDKISDKLFYTAFYEGLDSGLPKLKQIYTEVLQDSYDQLNSLYARGLTDADDEVQKLWKDILKYEKELRDIDDDIYENKIKNIERAEKMLPDTPDKYRKQVELAEQKILLARQRAAELWAEGTEEAMEKIHDIYQDEWDALEDKYKALRGLLDQEQDYLDDVSKAAQYVLDKRIDALKEQQEQLKETNKQREKEIELMKLRANLDAANNQKTVRVYRRGQGFVWEANKKAIQDAEKALNDFNKQNEEDELQKEIDALTKYKKQWSDVPKTIEEEENLKKIILQEGANFEQDILNQSTDRLNDYTDRYKANAEARIQVDKDELEAKKQVAEETKKLESEQYNINQNASSQNDRNVWYADTEGNAPKEAKMGDAIQTKKGLYVIVKEGTPGANYNQDTQRWSVLLDSFKTTFGAWTKELAGTSLQDDDLKKQVFSEIDELLGPFEEEILPDVTNGINDNTTNIFDLNTNITDLNKGLYIYSSDIRDAIIHGQDLVSAAAVHSRTAQSSANDAWSAANFAWARANDASNSANRAEMSSGPTSGTQNHKGIEMGPIGSDKGKQAFDSNLTRIARGDIKDDEMWALLQKGEAVFTPEQLDNITGALNYSLNSINKLSTLNNKMFSLGQLSAINSMPNNDNMKQQTVTFGNINITMNGVNDIDSFGIILRNNIKGIFAQTIAKE